MHRLVWFALLLVPAAWLHAELKLVAHYPAGGSGKICADTPLRLTFSEPIAPGRTGQLTVVRVRDGRMVDTLSIADRDPTNRCGTQVLRYEPFRIDGNTVTVQLHAHVLDSGTPTTYAIVIEPGLFQTAAGDVFGGITNGGWQFTTRDPLPPGRTRLEVAPDSRGDFCTVQGAVDYIPEQNPAPCEILIRNGTYDTVTRLGAGRSHIRIVGEDRNRTILAGRNNDRLNPGTLGRSFLGVDADDVTIENITLRNTTPYRGSQAEALRLAGQRCTVRDCDLGSFQDTLLLNGRTYVADCAIEGDVDFIWGYGTSFFENCELKAMHDGYYVTSRNPKDRFGCVFSKCRLTAAPGVKRNWLARIATDRFPDSAVAFLRCAMGDHIPAAGWLIEGNNPDGLRFLEFGSTTLDGEPLDTSQRHPASRRITATEAAALSDPNKVLAAADGWVPKP